MNNHLLSRVSAAAMMLLLTACASPLKAHIDMTASRQIVWPGGPEKPRIQYLWSLQNVGAVAEEGRSVGDVIAGRFEEDITDPRTGNMLLRPQGVYVDEKRYYIADPGAARVTVIERKTMDIFHITEAGDEELSYPKSVVADAEGNIYVADSDLKKVMVFNPNGKFKFSFSGEFRRPEGLTMDQTRGIMYIVDTDAQTVLLYGKDGQMKGKIGTRGEGPGEFNYPTYAWVDKGGNLFVTDFLNFRVQKFSPDGRFLGAIGRLGDTYDALEKPKGVAVDREGHVYIVDNAQDMVKIFDEQGGLLLFFGERGHGFGEFYMPTGIFIDEDNVIYIADTINMRIQAFQFLGGN